MNGCVEDHVADVGETGEQHAGADGEDERVVLGAELLDPLDADGEQPGDGAAQQPDGHGPGQLDGSRSPGLPRPGSNGSVPSRATKVR